MENKSDISADDLNSQPSPPSVRMTKISKCFPGVIANDQVDFSAFPGETHSLVGENGAGKSTLMKILYGLYRPDSGEIEIKGEKLVDHSPSGAIARGVGMVHQHFMLIPPLSVTENIVLGREFTRRKYFLDIKKACDTVADLADKYNLKIDPLARIWSLSVGEQQRVEILKILYRGADILILDEPTAVLTPPETDELFRTLRSLERQGKTIIFITHKLREVMALSDRVSVMRKGKLVGVKKTEATTPGELARLMVGRDVILRVEKKPAQPGPPVLEVRNLSARDRRGLPALRNVSFSVRAGEILGIAGVEGNGQTELLETIAGLRQPTSGESRFHGRDITALSPRKRFEAGLAHIPEDRLLRGLIPEYSIADNLILGKHYRLPFSGPLALHFDAVDRNARRQIESFDIRPPESSLPVRGLSGGNQQKTVLARELSREAKLLIAAQPTRGVDIGAIEFIHGRIIAARDAGMAVLLVSAELGEVMSLSDRILVIYEGEIVGEVDPKETTEGEIGTLMTGAKRKSGGGGHLTVNDQRSAPSISA